MITRKVYRSAIFFALRKEDLPGKENSEFTKEVLS